MSSFISFLSFSFFVCLSSCFFVNSCFLLNCLPPVSFILFFSFQVYTWGDKENGVVGHTNADGHQYLPRMLESLQAKTVKQVAACGFHTAALTDAGEIFTWGEGLLQY